MDIEKLIGFTSITSIPLSTAGNPILTENELEIKIFGDVGLLEHDEKREVCANLLPPGLLVLTNMRIIFIIDGLDSNKFCEPSLKSSSTKVGWGFNLKDVASIDDCSSSFLSRSSRLHINTVRKNQLLPQPDKAYEYFGFKFPSKNEDKYTLLSLTRQMITKSAWTSNDNQMKHHLNNNQVSEFSTNNAGVGGILKRQENNLREMDDLKRDALSDLDSLMKRAREVTSVIQRYAVYADSQSQEGIIETEGNESNHGNDSTSSSFYEVDEVNSIMQTIGITSPVTKFSAGKLYHEQLAKQLADFLLNTQTLQKMGGMVTFTDTFGLFNRARGMEFVSPNDFLCSAERIPHLNVGITIKKFVSGVFTFCLDTMTDQSYCNQLLSIIDKSNEEDKEEMRNDSTSTKNYFRDGITSPDVAKHFRISLILAKEMLFVAENSGLICRDDTISGLVFYKNLFS